jgi:hypothetical protein
MSPLALKLITTPLLITVATLAGRRWGQAMSGWLIAGLPVTSGAVAFFVTLDHGAKFGAEAATGSLAGAIAQCGFVFGYSRSRAKSWPLALVGGTLAFGACAGALSLIPIGAGLPSPLLPLTAATVLALAASLRFQPQRTASRSDKTGPSARWDLPLRIFIATAVVLTLTGVAQPLGPRLAGILATYPLGVAVITTFEDRQQGRVAASAVLRGLTLGLFTFTAFFFALATLLPRATLGLSFAAALAVGISLHGAVLLRRHELRGSG